MHDDQKTAEAFASSWNNLPSGSVYNRNQFEDWMHPLVEANFRGKDVLELGCGNGSLLVHTAAWRPSKLVAVDLGASVESARSNLAQAGFDSVEVKRGDLTTFQSGGFDLVYCIGVLHHLRDPYSGFEAVLRNTRASGKFHCWVYAKEGNALIMSVVDPIRKIASRLPWWFTKYLIATPLAVPFYVYAKGLRAYTRGKPNALRGAPLRDYCLWIAPREFAFFRHVAFDQLVTPQTTYLSREEVDRWLAENPRIEPSSTYVVFRNGNSWKFGGEMRRSDATNHEEESS